MVSSDCHYGCSEKANRICYALIFICLSLLFLAILIMAAVPPTSRDALTHHLAVPKLWIANGGMYEIPHLVVSYYPMNLDLIYVIPMLFGNDIIPKYLHFLFALVTAWLIYTYLKPRTTRTLSLLGALLFLSTPIIVKLSISVYVDLGLIFFSWASLFFLFEWTRSSQSPKRLIISAIFCGLGLGTKYNGMIVLLLLTLFVPIIYIRTSDHNHFKIKCALGYPILFFLIAMIVFSPWMIRNYHLTGNPIYPLYKDRIGSKTDRSEIPNISMKPWLQRKLIYRESALETILIPIRVFFQGRDDNPLFFDGKLNPILFLCPLLLLIKRKESDITIKREQLFLASFSILFLLYTSFMVDMRIRYIAPIIPPLVVLTVFGIGEMLRWLDGIGRKRMHVLGHWLLVGVVFFFLFINAKYIAAVFQSVNPVPYVFGETSREEYLKNKLPEYSAIQFTNQIRHGDMKVMALFLGNRLYYFDKPVEFMTQTFARIVADATADMTLATHLKNDGFTHLIINTKYFDTWVNRVFTDEQKKNVSQWLRDDCIMLFSKNGYAVYKLAPNDVNHLSIHQEGMAE